MRTDKLLLSIVLLILLAIGTGCNGGTNPIILSPDALGINQAGFIHGLNAVFNPADGNIWLAAAKDYTRPSSKLTVSIPHELPLTFETLPDGSFLFRFNGDENWSADVTWRDPSGMQQESYIEAHLPFEFLEKNVAEAGTYPNRLGNFEESIGIVNSGDDAIAILNPDDWSYDTQSVQFPGYSNPWDFELEDSIGFATTLFGGVYTFDVSNTWRYEVTTDGFTPFASPNGVAMFTETTTYNATYITNTNPISYFPTEFGDGWISVVKTNGSQGEVIAEIPTPFYNPQNVITHGDYVYVSCSGTIDWVAPDYVATALDDGGVLVIDPETYTIINSYNLGSGGPGPMAISPDGKYMYIGSGVNGWLFKIDLENQTVLNDASNPIVIDDFSGTFVPFVEISPDGLLVTASFNSDFLYFMDSFTGDPHPFPFFDTITLPEDDDTSFYGPQDAIFTSHDGQQGLLVLTTVKSALHWMPL